MKKLLKKRFMGPVNNVRDPLVWLGVSTSPYHLTNSPDLPETDRPSLEPTNSTVGNGSPPTEVKPFGSVCGFPPQKPEPPNLTITSTTSGDIQRFSDKKWQIPAIFLLFQRRSTWNPPDPRDIQRFSNKKYKYRRYFCFSDKDVLEIHQIRWDLAIFHRDLVQIQWIQPNIGQISPDLTKFRHRWRNSKPTGTNLKINGPELDDLTINTGMFRFWFSPTRIVRVGSGSSTNLTRPHLWTPLGVT